MFAATDPNPPDEVAALCDLIVPAFASSLDDEALHDDPAAVELVGSRLLLAIEQEELPPELPAAVVRELERRATATAATMLELVAALARAPLAAAAVAAVGRLADAGVVSPLAGRLGALSLRDATRCDAADEDGELFVAHLRRRGSRKTQLALLGIDRGETGGALASCLLLPPMTTARVRRIVESLDGGGATTAEPIAPAALVAAVRAGAQRAVDIGLALDADSAAALPLVARALTGDPMGLPRPDAAPPWDDDDPELLVDAAEDEDHYVALRQRLLDEFEQHARAHHEPASAVWHSGDFVAGCMLEWKGGYGDGLLGRWTGDDVAEFLLDYVPRKVSASAETLEVVPECVLAFIAFLEARGSLSGDPLETLAEACSALAEPFRESVADPAGWGIAKSMMMAMFAEGIDPEDPAAVDAWMADFNARPRELRDAVVGPALDRMTAAAPGSHASAGPRGSARGSSAPRRAKQRKAQRSARKNNRPRR